MDHGRYMSLGLTQGRGRPRHTRAVVAGVDKGHVEILRKERSGFRLRAPAALTPAKRLNVAFAFWM